MKEDIRALLECDNIYMLDKWETSKGAVIEHAVALSCGIKILINIEEDDGILTEEQT